jgi:hypothetical protein
VFSWLRLFRETKGKKYEADGKKLLSTLDIGSHINAGPQPLLEAVGWTPLFGAAGWYDRIAA